MKTKIYILVLLVSLSSIAQNYYTIDGREYFKENGKWFIKDLKTDEKYLLNELIFSVKLKDHSTRPKLLTLNSVHNITIERENHLGIVDLRIPEGSKFYSILRAYLDSNLFEFVEMDSYGKFESTETTPNGPLFFNQHHFYNYSAWPHINIPLAWDFENGSTSPIIVAVLDAGVWMSHQDLNYASSHYDFVDDDYDPTPFLIEDHGTGVAGVFAAKTNNNLLISSVAGGWGDNFGSQVMAVRVGTESENQQTWSSRVDDGILFAVDNGAKVINMSFRCSETNAIKTAIDYAYNVKGCLLVAAGGNKTNELYPYFPANYNKVIAVGGISKTWLHWGNKGIELVAPAQQIISTSNGDFAIAYFDATSFSAPQVSGVAALLFSRKPNLLPKDVRNVLNLAAVYESQMENDPAKFGSGLLKADRSIQGILLGAGFIPDYPTNLSCEAIPNTNPVLKWLSVAPTLRLITTISHYNIYRSIAPSKYNFSKVGEVQHNENLQYHAWIDNSVTVPSSGQPYYFYRVTSVDFSGKESITSNEVWVDAKIGWKTNTDMVDVFDYGLDQNFPNPFNPSTTIKYSIKEDGFVKLTIFDILGQEVENIVNEFKSAGNYLIQFNAANLPSGIYFYRLESDIYSKIQKMILLK